MSPQVQHWVLVSLWGYCPALHQALVSRLVLVSHLVLVSPQVYDPASHLESVSL